MGLLPRASDAGGRIDWWAARSCGKDRACFLVSSGNRLAEESYFRRPAHAANPGGKPDVSTLAGLG
jgi:hypothetical protein